jgi:NitT/TauT family transport system substrate-binding protein
MSRFRIQTHGRLQEWVAEEKGYFKDEGLDYEFVVRVPQTWSAGDRPAAGTPREVVRGAFEGFAAGRGCEISAACHWATSMAASARHGRMWGHAYAVTPAGIYVPPESPIRQPGDLADVTIAVGYHSGSHFSTLQALEPVLKPDEIKLQFIGYPFDRLTAALERTVPATALFGVPQCVVEQQGFRKVVDTTFMVGFIVEDGAEPEDVERYFRALRRAQRDIDLEPERYKHYFLRELPECFHSLADVRTFDTGERIVCEPYTIEAFERTHRWMETLRLFPAAPTDRADYEDAVLV